MVPFVVTLNIHRYVFTASLNALSNDTLMSLALNLTEREWQQFSYQLQLRDVNSDADVAKLDCFNILTEFRGKRPNVDTVRRIRKALESCQKHGFSKALKKALDFNQHVDFTNIDHDGNLNIRKLHGKMLDSTNKKTQWRISMKN